MKIIQECDVCSVSEDGRYLYVVYSSNPCSRIPVPQVSSKTESALNIKPGRLVMRI